MDSQIVDERRFLKVLPPGLKQSAKLCRFLKWQGSGSSLPWTGEKASYMVSRWWPWEARATTRTPEPQWR